MKRIIVKLSGEALAGDKHTGFDEETVRKVAVQIKELIDDKYEIGIVIGGGNFWRGRSSKNIDRTKADQIGMLATVMNCIYTSEIFRSVGMKTEVIEYDRDKRYAGKTKYGLRSMISYALDSITGISVEPLRKISVFLPVTLLMFIGSIVGIFLAPPEWTAACVVIMTACLLTGFILISLAVMAEYIAQIMIEAKGRPTSVIYEYEPCRNVKERQ